MPAAERRQTPAGQPYGDQARQQQFMAESALPAPTPQLPAEVPEPELPPELTDLLLGPSLRPDEPVSAGLSATRPETLAEALERMANIAGSPDVVALAREARVLGF